MPGNTLIQLAMNSQLFRLVVLVENSQWFSRFFQYMSVYHMNVKIMKLHIWHPYKFHDLTEVDTHCHCLHQLPQNSRIPPPRSLDFYVGGCLTHHATGEERPRNLRWVKNSQVSKEQSDELWMTGESRTVRWVKNYRWVKNSQVSQEKSAERRVKPTCGFPEAWYSISVPKIHIGMYLKQHEIQTVFQSLPPPTFPPDTFPYLCHH